MVSRFAYPAAAALLFAAGPASALVIAFKPPAQRAITADVVVVGTVTSVEKEPVEVSPGPNIPNKIAYKLAVVKVDQPLSGADALTHLKVGFMPPPPPVAQPGGPIRPPILRRGGTELKVGDQYVLFLSRHHEGNFYVMPFASPPIDAKGEAGKAELAEAKKALAVVADPKKALTAAKADERAFAASALVMKYRNHPDTGGEVTETPIPPDESKLILKGLAEGDWKQGARFHTMSPFMAFNQLGLTPQDGWNPPRPMPRPGQPSDFAVETKTAFLTWLDGPGRDYRIKRIVPKK